MPRKRFVKQPVLDKANEYLGTDHSYRKTAEHEGMPIMYDDRIRTEKKQPVGLAPSTVWRWLSWLGRMTASYLVRHPRNRHRVLLHVQEGTCKRAAD